MKDIERLTPEEIEAARRAKRSPEQQAYFEWVQERNRMIRERGAQNAYEAANGGPIGAGKFVKGKPLK